MTVALLRLCEDLLWLPYDQARKLLHELGYVVVDSGTKPTVLQLPKDFVGVFFDVCGGSISTSVAARERTLDELWRGQFLYHDLAIARVQLNDH